MLRWRKLAAKFFPLLPEVVGESSVLSKPVASEARRGVKLRTKSGQLGLFSVHRILADPVGFVLGL